MTDEKKTRTVSLKKKFRQKSEENIKTNKD
jgi:hypothetical protein